MLILRRIERWLDAIGRVLLEPWVWNAFMVLMGGLALTMSWVCYPVGNDVHALGFDLMGPCEFQQLHGVPCASCGMTRSWVWMARGHLPTALSYNIAGTLLYIILLAGGLLGTVRLTFKRDVVRIRWYVALSLVLGWVFIYAGSWSIRLLGWYPLLE